MVKVQMCKQIMETCSTRRLYTTSHENLLLQNDKETGFQYNNTLQ